MVYKESSCPYTFNTDGKERGGQGKGREKSPITECLKATAWFGDPVSQSLITCRRSEERVGPDPRILNQLENSQEWTNSIGTG